MAILFCGGMVFDGENLMEKADVLVKDGRIAAIGQGVAGNTSDIRTVQAEGCLIAPGFIDLHTHLRQPGFEEKETIKSGTMAALAGGFTTVCAMPNLNPVPDRLENLDVERAVIEADAQVRILPYGAITKGQKGEILSDIEGLAPFVAGFSDDGVGVQDEKVICAAMEAVAKAGSMVAAHCETVALLPPDGVCVQADSWFARTKGFKGYPNESEWSEIERDIRVAEKTGCRLHICHLSTQEGFTLVKQAKERGVNVTCEVTPHNLLLSCDDIEADDGRFKMNPPLRMGEDTAAALAAVLDGTVDAVATDHAPHTETDKAGGFAKSVNGVVGLETAFPVLYTKLVQSGKMPLKRLLELFTSGPGRVLKQEGNRIQEGEIADLVLIDLEANREVDPDLFFSKGRATPFDGWKLKGWPLMTLVKGEIAWDGLYRRFLGQAGKDG